MAERGIVSPNTRCFWQGPYQRKKKSFQTCGFLSFPGFFFTPLRLRFSNACVRDREDWMDTEFLIRNSCGTVLGGFCILAIGREIFSFDGLGMAGRNRSVGNSRAWLERGSPSGRRLGAKGHNKLLTGGVRAATTRRSANHGLPPVDRVAIGGGVAARTLPSALSALSSRVSN